MKETKVTLSPLTADDREQFISDNQWAFKYGAMMEFGERDNHIDDNGEIISRRTIEHCLDEENNEAYRIVLDRQVVGGAVIKIDPIHHHNHLELFFVDPNVHSRGIGFGAWKAIETLHPETEVWETCTPYFEKRNIHFYVNKCGFHIVEFYNEFNIDPNTPLEDNFPDEPHSDERDDGPDEMFRFIKVMKPQKENTNGF